MKRAFSGLLLALAIIALGAVPLLAQSPSGTLVNGGLEEDTFGPYAQRRGGEFPIYLPNSWDYWFGPQNGDRINVAAKIAVRPHPGPGPNPQEGRRAINIDCGFYICTVAVYQQIANLQSGANVQASAFSQVKACNLPSNGTSCGSAVESGAQTRIGIDPNGGTDPNDTDIVWSGWVQPHDQWVQQSVSATTTSTGVTLFLYSTQSSVADLNKTYWDNVVFSGGGTGGVAPSASTPVPTAPPAVSFVVPQATQEDGSIVHSVQVGDTVDSIAYAYGVTRSAILEQNSIADPRLIYPGQKLIIKPGNAQPAVEESPVPADSQPADTAAAQPVPTSQSAPEATAQPQESVPADSSSPAGPPSEPAQPEPASPAESAAPAPVVVANAAALDPASTTGQICVLLFTDGDRNRIQEQGETLLAGGSISLLHGTDSAGLYQTDGISEPRCFNELAAGEYTAVAAAPQGFGLTTPDQLRIRLNPGATVNLTFGAAEGLQPLVAPPPDSSAAVLQPVVEETAPRSLAEQILSISGLLVFGLAGLVLVGGVGAALLLRRR